MEKLLYTVFHFLCSKCNRLWETICKSDLYCPFCNSQGLIVSQSEVKDINNDTRTGEPADKQC